ncbi:MAG: nucleotidyltransferase family protein [Gammaproteobacteria bacterium]|nr:nucleotidyltransferase family protein [Gammaproteobacteria bacterium]
MIQGILLAAGHSSRYGSNKLLESLEGGMPVALVSALKLKENVDRLLVVIKPEDEELKALFDKLEIETLICDRSSLGIGESIACAVRASHDASAWIIALADMPYIQSETIATLVNMMRVGAAISAPMLKGRHGHPVGFKQTFLDELIQLTGDEGARSIIAAHKQDFAGFACQDKGIHRDIDFPSDIILH